MLSWFAMDRVNSFVLFGARPQYKWEDETWPPEDHVFLVLNGKKAAHFLFVLISAM